MSISIDVDDCNRRIFLVATPSSEGLLTEPIAAAQPRWQELLFTPQQQSSGAASRIHHVEQEAVVPGPVWRIKPVRRTELFAATVRNRYSKPAIRRPSSMWSIPSRSG